MHAVEAVLTGACPQGAGGDAAEACADRLLQMIEVSVRRYTDELERTECILPMRLEIERLREQVTDLMDELAYHGIYPSDLMGGEGQ